MPSKLSIFLQNKMSMTEVYQPVIIKALLEHGGACTKNDLAIVLASYDNSFVEYYRKIVMRWPKVTLTKHGIVSYEKRGELFQLNESLVDLENSDEEIRICEQKIAEWLAKKQGKAQSPKAGESLRYKVLARSKGKCELCGISASLRPIDIDHIVPQSMQNKYGKVNKEGRLIDVHSEDNLQALCYKCNRAKRANDDTDFRRTKKLVRDAIPDVIRADGRVPKVKTLTGSRLVSALQEKLIEEHEEYIAEKDKEKSLLELADMIEVVFALAQTKGCSKAGLLALAEKKKAQYGGFDQGFYYEGDADR